MGCKLTTEMLTSSGACKSALDYFEMKFGDSARVTVKNLWRLLRNTDSNSWLSWMAGKFLPRASRVEYSRYERKHVRIEDTVGWTRNRCRLERKHLRLEAKLLVKLWNRGLKARYDR